MVCRNCHIALGQRYSYTGTNALRTITVLCGTCAEALTGLGMDVRLERTETERRRRFPARDLTGWITGPSIA